MKTLDTAHASTVTLPALPEGWRWARLGEVCEEPDTRDPLSEPDKPFQYVDITSVNAVTKRIVAPKTLLGQVAPSRARQVIRTSDVLIATTRPNLNAVALVPSELNDQICSTGFCVLHPKAGLDSGYLFAFVQSTEFIQGLSDLVTGALYPAVTDKQVRAQRIPLPPLEEQQRIAAILHERLTAVERARAATEAQVEAAKALPATYLRAVFSGPQVHGWPRKQLEEFCDLLPAKSITTFGDCEVMAITTACLTEIGFQSSGVKSARMWSKDAAECVVSNGEILMARSNTPELVGRIAMFSGQPKGVVASDLTIRIRCRHDVEPQFTAAYLSWLYLSGYWKERAGGASGSMKKITRTQIQSVQIPIPPDSEQRRIASQLSAQMASAERLRRTLAEQLDAINKLPAALLRQAFSGQL